MMRTVDVPDPAGLRLALSAGLRAAVGLPGSDGAARGRQRGPGPHLHAIADAAVGLGEHDAAARRIPGGGDGQLAVGALALEANRLILGLGLLLQPVMHSRPAALQKSLVLPLPKTGMPARAARSRRSGWSW
jgi:type VI secretion system protein ImpM